MCSAMTFIPNRMAGVLIEFRFLVNLGVYGRLLGRPLRSFSRGSRLNSLLKRGSAPCSVFPDCLPVHFFSLRPKSLLARQICPNPCFLCEKSIWHSEEMVV